MLLGYCWLQTNVSELVGCKNREIEVSFVFVTLILLNSRNYCYSCSGKAD